MMSVLRYQAPMKAPRFPYVLWDCELAAEYFDPRRHKKVSEACGGVSSGRKCDEERGGWRRYVKRCEEE